ncbi:MAG: ComEA family DNA-binding protein [Gammaproteobacteria bacterium]|nr:ComEA family DNA-binding protein [Gammaproteobacteria bacterium]
MEIFKRCIFVVFLSICINAYAEDPIDLNSADKATLMMVKGVGESRAQAIINYRDRYGPFGSVDELAEVDGIGQATVEANREILIVNKK